ncbi:hypothetical protein [Spiroplasma endosymbiont of Apeira syringaria]|uniref:hypothetical protein n=1 Tax=Spiroplasma endosymbiont of Apeira syringaria TaxID=3066307 RepID=UPI0030CE67F2
MQENFYIKKVYYGAYVKNIILPMSAILNNKRNEVGIKNLGINDKKLRNSTTDFSPHVLGMATLFRTIFW